MVCSSDGSRSCFAHTDSCTEWTFTRFIERGRGYTSAAQLIANVLYTPCLLGGYSRVVATVLSAASTHASFLAPLASSDYASAAAYITLFPLNIWLYEALLGQALGWFYGHNVAYCYDDYADAFCDGCCRLGHGVFWLGLGAACLCLQQPLEQAASALASFFTCTLA